MNKKSGIATNWLVVLGFALIIGSSYWLWVDDIKPRLENKNKEEVFCAADAMLCPDGSAVSRTGPNCEFATCPEKKDLPDDHPIEIEVNDPENTKGWKTRRNDTFGYKFDYPSDWNNHFFSDGAAVMRPYSNYDETPAVVVQICKGGENTEECIADGFKYINFKTDCVSFEFNGVSSYKCEPPSGKLFFGKGFYIFSKYKENLFVLSDNIVDEVSSQILSSFRFLE